MKKSLLLSAILLCTVWMSYGQWTYTDLSEPKSFMGSATLGNKAYFAGGYNGTNFLTTVEVYDITTGTWEFAGDLSDPREFVGGVISCGSKVFFAGGWDYSESHSTVDIYNTVNGQWTIEQLSVPRFSMAAVSHLNKVMFAGGFIYPGQTRTNVVDIYDNFSGEWTTDHLTIAREGIAAAVVGDLAIFAGGITNSGSTDQVDIYNFTNNTWSTAILSQARGMASATTVGNLVIIAGGVTSFNNPSDVVDIYDASTDTWSTATLSFPRSAQTNDATINGKAFFAGGGIFKGNGYDTPSDVIDIYDPASETWSTDRLTQPLMNHSVVEIGDYLIVAGGENDDGDYVAQVEIYRDPTLIHVPADYSTIQEGINAASDGDTVLVADGLYYENINLLGRKPLMVASHYLMTGDTSHISNTIIDGSQLTDMDNASVVAFKSGEDTTSILCGFTVRGGSGTYVTSLNNRCGGGIYISGSGAKIIHNKITGNTLDDTQPVNGQSVYGAGIGTRNDDGAFWLVIEHNLIYGNTAVTGYEWSGGGGVYTAYNAIIAYNDIYENTTTSVSTGWGAGGGISHIGSGATKTLVVHNNKIHHNIAQSSTGVGTDGGMNSQYAHLVFTHNEVFSNNGICPGITGGVGGLTCVDPAEGCIISYNIFRENISTNIGGGIHLQNVANVPDPNLVILSDNYFLDNEAEIGGAVSDWDIPILFQNNVCSGNHSTIRGGALMLNNYAYDDDIHMAILINNSFSGNSSDYYGGAIYSIKAMPLIFNSIFFNDSAGFDGPEIYLNHYLDTLDIANCNIDQGLIYGNIFNGGGNINGDPKFDDTELLTLLDDSPCIDFGTQTYLCCHGDIHLCPQYDILGIPRPQYNAVDIGAYEFFGVGFKDYFTNENATWYQISPNPFCDHTTITYKLDREAEVEILLYNSNGLLIKTLLSESLGKGSHTLEFMAGDLPAGIYFCRMVAGKLSATGRMVIIK